MFVVNPFGEFQRECQTVLADALTRTLPELGIIAPSMGKPSNPNFGQLASSVSFELAKKLKRNPNELASKIVAAVTRKISN